MDDSKYTKNRNWLVTCIVGLIIIGGALGVTFLFIIGTSHVDGQSMYPTLNDNQTVFFFRREASYENGEIVAIDLPSGDSYVKRVIGVAGDEIDIRDGVVYRNGQALDEPYIQGKTEPTSDRVYYPFTVSEGKVFVLGDNRENSIDSRFLGEISLYSVKGKILGAQ